MLYEIVNMYINICENWSILYTILYWSHLQMRGTADQPPPPQDNHDGDHGEVPGEPAPEDDEFDMRPDKDAMDAAIADFLKRLEP